MSKLVEVNYVALRLNPEDWKAYKEIKVMISVEELEDIRRKHSPIYLESLKELIGEKVLACIS